MSPDPPGPLLVASNRGPSITRGDGGGTSVSRAAGGLSAAILDVLLELGGTWIAAAMSPAERDAGPVEFGPAQRLRYVDVDPTTFDAYYNGLSNRVLWFAHHYLWDVPNTPAFGQDTRAAWKSYVEVNAAFAGALLEEAGDRDASYLIQDYHLSLVPMLLREARPEARIAYFHHIPFAEPGYLRILPDEIVSGVLEGMLGADVVGFHAERWARNFLDAARHVKGARVDGRRGVVTRHGRKIRVDVNPISIDPAALREQAARPEVQANREGLRREPGELLVFRADRMELSKNIVRGFLAFERLLEAHPGWRDRVRFLAHAYPSREAIPEYGVYAERCERAAARVNDRYPGSVELIVRDDFDEVLAAYLEYDVLLVNPAFDGMNLVAKEGPVINERDGVLVLSRNAGAAEGLGRHALLVNPFDVEETAEALHDALSMRPATRARRARGLREAAEAGSAGEWIERQLAALSGPGGPA